MRFVLTILAVALVALLIAALIAPLFIDWSAHRAAIEARIGALTGGRVALTGPISVRLLPIPYLDLGEGSASGPKAGHPRLSFKSARLELSLVKLATGAIRFTEIRLEGPVLTLTRLDNGSLNLPAPNAGEAGSVGFDRLVARGGLVRVLGQGGAPTWTIRVIDLDATAPTLAGPFRAFGNIEGSGGAPVSFRFASSVADASGVPLHIAVEKGPAWPEFAFDGALTLAGDGAKAPRVIGSASVTGFATGADGQIPWHVAGSISADLTAAKLTNAVFRFGPEERAVRADVDATLVYGTPPRLLVRAKAKQANVDALLRRKGEEGVPPRRAAAMLAAALDPPLVKIGGVDVDVDVAVRDIILGSETMSEVVASVNTTPGSPLKTRIDVRLPGRSHLKADGQLQTGPAARFQGWVDFSTEDLPLLHEWASKGAPGSSEGAAALGEVFDVREAALSGEVDASAAGLSGRSLRLTVGRSTLSGSLAFTDAVGSEPSRLYADLSSDSLEVETLPTLSAGVGLLTNLDLSVALRAKSLHVSRLGEGAVDSGSLALKVEKRGPTTTLEELTIANLGGASLDARGTAGPEGVTATGHLDASKLRDFALLVARLSPGTWSEPIAERAPLLSPTSIDFDLQRTPSSSGELVPGSLRAKGSIGQTRILVAVDPGRNREGSTIALDLDAPEGVPLLRQFGVTSASASTGKAHIGLHATGSWSSGYEVDAVGSLAGANVSASGRFAPAAEGDEARLFGSAKLRSANVGPFASALGLTPSGRAIGPLDIEADATLRGARWTISRLSGTISGVKANGELAYEAPKAAVASIQNPDLSLAEEAVNGPAVASIDAPQPTVTGELSFDRLPLLGLLTLPLGLPLPAKAETIWSEASFGDLPSLTLPPVAVRVSAPALDVGNGLTAQSFSAMVQLSKGRLDLDDMAMKIASGTVTGDLTLRNNRKSATLSGTLAADRLAISQGRLSGRIGGTLEFASTGKSPHALIAGLAGAGEARLANIEFAGSDPGALDRVVARSQAASAELDETNIAYQFGQELDKAPLTLPDATTALSLSGGTIKLGPFPIPRRLGAATLGASFDLIRLSLETRLTIASPSGDLKFWQGPPPTATIIVEDALSAPKRDLEVAGLSASLATQAIARDTDRIANLDADIRERAFFNRRLKGERFMDRRNAEIEDWRAERARLKGLAERLAAQRTEEAAKEETAAEAEAIKRLLESKLPPDLFREPPFPTTPTRSKSRPSRERDPATEPKASGLPITEKH